MIEQLVVDGVPVVLGRTSGPVHAGLVFRVGFADEPLSRRGITHLVEHLALHSTGVTDYHYNGQTGVEHTFFHMQGAEADVVAFLNGVCASLRELPMHRLAVEKDVLRAEANSRGAAVNEAMPLWRHGARDYGVASFPEWGVPAFTPDDLNAWVARYFTKENAVLWVAGDGVPEGLRLDLPGGTRRRLPQPSSALHATPAYFNGPGDALVWDAEVARTAAAAVFTGVLERTMFRELRQETGLSYTAKADSDPLGPDRVLITAVADALPERHGAVAEGFLDLLASLRAGRIGDADVTAVVNQRVEALRHAESQGGRLPGQAFNVLAGRPVVGIEQAVAELRAVTAADVTRVAAEACATGLLMVPDGVTADRAGFAAAPVRSEHAVEGESYVSLTKADGRLIVSAAGVSLTGGEDHLATVLFDDCVIVRAWPDGARQLIGHDGMVVHIEPNLYRGCRAAIPWLDARVPADIRVDMPARDPGRIPQPPRPTVTRVWQEPGFTRFAGFAAAGGLVAIAMLVAFGMAVGANTAGNRWLYLTYVLLGLAATGLLGRMALRSYRAWQGGAG